MKIDTDKLVTAPQLLEEIFAPDCRPKLRWLRDQTSRRKIPYIKIGRSVWFDVAEVRKALEKRHTIRAL